jgi:hypothetical protein
MYLAWPLCLEIKKAPEFTSEAVRLEFKIICIENNIGK